MGLSQLQPSAVLGGWALEGRGRKWMWAVDRCSAWSAPEDASSKEGRYYKVRMYDNQTVCWRLFKSVKALVGVIVKSPKHSFEALLSPGSTKPCTRVRWWTTLPQTSWLWHRRLVTRKSIALSIPRNSSVQINVQMQVSSTLRGIGTKLSKEYYL